VLPIGALVVAVVFVMLRSATRRAGTKVEVVAVLLRRLLSLASLPPVTVLWIVPLFVTFTMRVKVPTSLTAIEAFVHVINPVAPTAGVVQLQPGATMDWYVVPEGVDCVNVAFGAASGPLFVMVCV
jgi:hypothetical protein